MDMEIVRYDFQTIKSENAFEHAKAKGLEIRLPNNNELLIDIDSEEDYLKFKSNLEKFETHVALVIKQDERASKSCLPGKCHIVLTLNRGITPSERIMFQLFLGSDRMRELLSYVRLLNSDPVPTLFYEKPLKGLLGTSAELQMQCDEEKHG